MGEAMQARCPRCSEWMVRNGQYEKSETGNVVILATCRRCSVVYMLEYKILGRERQKK